MEINDDKEQQSYFWGRICNVIQVKAKVIVDIYHNLTVI